MRSFKWQAGFGLAAMAAVAIVGCGGGEAVADNGTTGGEVPTGYSGEVIIDGSSTVTPIMIAVADEFSRSNPESRVTVGTSGSGGGFKKFVVGETDISMASRPIKTSEADLAKENGIEFIEIPVAYDGLTVVINKDNDWATDLTVEELNMIWDDGSSVSKWSQVRSSFPDEDIKLYGPGTDSGTFDYFTEVINGDGGRSRADYQASEDDNVLVQGVAGDKGALGYFGFVYYEENKDKLNAVKVNGGDGSVGPSIETISNGTYAPLSRPLFIYVNKANLATNDTLKAVVDYLLGDGAWLVGDVGYVGMPEATQNKVIDHFNNEVTGTRYATAEAGMSVEEVLASDPY